MNSTLMTKMIDDKAHWLWIAGFAAGAALCASLSKTLSDKELASILLELSRDREYLEDLAESALEALPLLMEVEGGNAKLGAELLAKAGVRAAILLQNAHKSMN
jgi:hypothetical protein